MECDPCGSLLSNAKSTISPATRTYSHRVQVLLELLRNLVCELATRDRATSPGPVPCRNLLSQLMRGNTTGTTIPTWTVPLDG
jgi:hypothetical protein